VDALNQWSKRYKSYGDYSVTTLLNSPRQVHLQKRHGAQVVREPEQQIAAFIGTGVHSMFEESLRLQAILDPKYEIERTVFDKIQNRLITGKFDILYDNKHLYDIKTCKVWKKVFDPDLVEWHQQLNMYAWMLRNRGLDIKSINVIAIYMDWQQQRSFRDDSYPNEPIIEYELKLWQDDYTEKYINGRIKLMVESETLTDEQLPFCTTEEMWQRASETTYAVMPKKEATRASKIFPTLEEAKGYGRDKFATSPDAFIEIRRPDRTRCERWCDGKDWCSQYRDYSANKERILKEIVPI
jgi:hypothetical protein